MGSNSKIRDIGGICCVWLRNVLGSEVQEVKDRIVIDGKLFTGVKVGEPFAYSPDPVSPGEPYGVSVMRQDGYVDIWAPLVVQGW